MDEQVLRCRAIYERMLDHIVDLNYRKSDSVITWITLLASFSWFNPTGNYADGRLEQILLELGGSLSDAEEPASTLEVRKHELLDSRPLVLHVATRVYQTGGHSRVIANWIKLDTNSRHSLIILNQETEQVPEWLAEAVESSGGKLYVLDSSLDVFTRAGQLRAAANGGVHFVILHHHPNDVLPLLAFATPAGPPVAVFNHADHVFWLGSSIADLVIDFRADSPVDSRKLRFAKDSLVLPLPLASRTSETDWEIARQRLGIPKDQVVLLSVGTGYKYLPTPKYDFFRTCTSLLDRNVNAHLYVIGVSPAARSVQHDRIHLLGPIADPSLYYAAADIYLNGFPYGAGLALLEAGLAGACPVVLNSGSLVLRDIALQGLVKPVTTEAEYIGMAESLIRDAGERQRLGEQVREQVSDYHAGPKWLEYLNTVYGRLENTEHRPTKIPAASAMEIQDSLSPPSRHTGPLILSLGFEYFSTISLRDALALLVISLKSHDTHLALSDLRCWRPIISGSIRRTTKRLRGRLTGLATGVGSCQ